MLGSKPPMLTLMPIFILQFVNIGELSPIPQPMALCRTKQ